MKTEGLHSHRRRREPLEDAFAEFWDKEGPNVLPYLLSATSYKVDVTDREALVAATVVQWFGSPVGSRYLTNIIGSAAGKPLREQLKGARKP